MEEGVGRMASTGWKSFHESQRKARRCWVSFVFKAFLRVAIKGFHAKLLTSTPTVSHFFQGQV